MIKFIVVAMLMASIPKGFAAYGGYKVFCKVSTEKVGEQIFIGHYFLDYLVARLNNPADMYFTGADEMIKHLQSKIPELSIKYSQMLNSYKVNSNDGAFVWQEGKLRNMNDVNLIFKLPENCSGDPVQVIRRFRYNSQRVYFRYNKNEIVRLHSQLSWVMLNQLLWDYYKNDDEVRMVNEFLHLKSNSHLSSQEFLDELNKVASQQEFLALEIFEEVENLYVEVDMLEKVFMSAPTPENLEILEIQGRDLLVYAEDQLMKSTTLATQKAYLKLIKKIELLIKKLEIMKKTLLFQMDNLRF